MKYKYNKELAGQFGNKCFVHVIYKKYWFGYFPTLEYYFNESSAQKRVDELNNYLFLKQN